MRIYEYNKSAGKQVETMLPGVNYSVIAFSYRISRMAGYMGSTRVWIL